MAEDCVGYDVEKVAEIVGLNDAEKKALSLLTHGEGVPYLDYVHALGSDPIARKVKIADLEHNLDLSRLGGKQPRKYDLMVESLAYLRQIEDEEKQFIHCIDSFKIWRINWTLLHSL